MVSNAEPPHSQNNNQIWECLPTTSNYVDQIAFSPDGKILASFYNASTETIKLWDVATGQQLYTANFVDLQEVVRDRQGIDFCFCKSLFFSPNEKALAYILTCMGFIWDFALGKVVSVKALQSPFGDYPWNNLALSPDLQIAVSTNSNTGIMKLWETSTGREIHTFSIGEKVWDIYINQFSPDGKIFASLIWLDHFPFEETIKLWEVGTGTELCSISVKGVTADNKYSGVLAFSSDSRILASNCGDSFPRLGNGRILKEETQLLRSTILLTDVVTGQQLCKFEGLNNYLRDRWGFCCFLRKKVVSLAFSPDDQFLASGDSTGTITLWQLKKGSLQPLTSEKIRTFSHVSKQPIKTLAFSPDGQTLATGHGDNNGGITLWDIKTGSEICILEQTLNHITSLNFSGNGEVLVSSYSDGTITVWQQK